MPQKKPDTDAELPWLIPALANANEANSHPSSQEEDNVNDRFDWLEQTFQTEQSSQKELLEKVEGVEEQVLEQESRLSSLEKAFTSLKKENNALKLKVDDLKDQSRQNNIKIWRSDPETLRRR